MNDLIKINRDRYQLIPSVNKYAPWKTVQVRGEHLPWIGPELTSLFRQKDQSQKDKNPQC